ncbi:hypothetical protein S245_044679, partial [Arachis hypogaea]
FQHLTLEKENKSKVYNPIFHRQQHPKLNQLSKAFFKAKKLWRSPMIDAIASMGAGYKGPSYPRVRGYLLSKLVEDVRKMINGY